MNKKMFHFCLGCILLIFCSRLIDAQIPTWKEIRPLETSCSDIKRIFGIQKCKFPITRIEMAHYDVTINFGVPTDKWHVSSETVVDALFIFNELPKLSDLETDLATYSKKRETDVPEIMIYRNDCKGIELTVQTAVADEPYVSDLFLSPPVCAALPKNQ